jgi:hypothetical protein
MFPAVVFGAILNADDSAVLVEVVSRKTTCKVQNNSARHYHKKLQLNSFSFTQPNESFLLQNK